MAVTRDIEQQVEDAFIGVLGAHTDIITTYAASVRRWKDAANDKTYPVVAVHCSPVDQHQATPEVSTGVRLYVAQVELGVLTYGWTDKSMTTARALLGAIRDCLSQSSLLAALDAVSGVDVTFAAVLPAGGAHEVDIENVNQISMTVTAHVYL
jgi:hypothetical protein